MLIDATKVRADQANAAADYLCKSVEDSLLFEPHPTDRILAAMEDAATEPGRQALHALYGAFLRVLVTGGGTIAKADPGHEEACRALDRKAAHAPPGSLGLADYLAMIDCLLGRYLPESVLQSAAKRQAVKQYLSGFLRQDLVPKTAAAAGEAIATLPETIRQATRAYPLTRLDESRLAVAEASAARLVSDLTASARSRMRKIIIDAERARIGSGQQSYAAQPNLQQTLSDAFGDLNRDWRRIAVAETAIHGSDGFLAASPPGTQVRWVAHPGACQYCESQNGKVFTVVPADAPRKDPETQVWVGKHLLNVGRAIARRKRLDDGTLVDREPDELVVPAIPAHPNCLLPGQHVAAASVVAAMKGFYEGWVIEIHTKGGRWLTVTENHPVLTPFGFRAAKFLSEGDHVVASPDPERIAATINPDDYQAPAVIEDVYRTRQHAGAMLASSMEVAPEDFHGDGRFMHGQVEIVYPHRFLRSYGAASMSEQVQELALCGVERGDGLSGLSTPLQHGDRFALPSPRGLGCHGQSSALGLRRPGHPRDHGRAAITRLDASFQQELAKGRTLHSRFSRQFLLRFAQQVPAEIAGVDCGMLPTPADAWLIQDEIVRIDRMLYAGEVFDLQDHAYELYSGNGIIVKNCRCVWTFEVALTPEQRRRLGRG